jgi:hypothetical protein
MEPAQNGPAPSLPEEVAHAFVRATFLLIDTLTITSLLAGRRRQY